MTDHWGDREWALYRYLTQWADFTSIEATNAVNNPTFPPFNGDSPEGIYCPMEKQTDRRAA